MPFRRLLNLRAEPGFRHFHHSSLRGMSHPTRRKPVSSRSLAPPDPRHCLYSLMLVFIAQWRRKDTYFRLLLSSTGGGCFYHFLYSRLHPQPRGHYETRDSRSRRRGHQLDTFHSQGHEGLPGTLLLTLGTGP